MKLQTTELLVLGLAGIAVYMIWRSQTPRVNAPRDTGKPMDWVDEIFDSAGKAFTNGWRYFENGVAIDPSGNYYQNGQMVWQAPGAGA
ncbi:hypothetical protein Q5W_09655 [Hydrogenophaga sp. PBC]|uniref:hypothetical protein n=1 Tax=Hydrogenophaga sp. PBC TaxID=795665 RepID=UPI0002607744|nr:hypothetical protein [Hydrogenophaga sp. PBC]AOS79209.1 hypothetical protein Q5W_09655 [Hydrogenophaga sp. PBC]